MQSGFSVALGRAVRLNLLECPDYFSRIPSHPPQLLRLLVPSKPGLFANRLQVRPTASGPLHQVPVQGSSDLITMEGKSKLENILPALQLTVPSLAQGQHKGEAGKIAVIGGCREYTGAPFFSAISALKVGADLAHVFCTAGAATVIKSYSPELIVHPVLHESHDTGELGVKERCELKAKVIEDVEKWLQRFDCFVIGPGLGRDAFLLDCVVEIIQIAKSFKIPLVVDGDGLFVVTNQPELVMGYPLAVLTPNANEYKRLVAKVIGEKNHEGPVNWREVPDEDRTGQLQALAKKMGGVTIVQKGKTDYISDGTAVISSDYFGSPRRCGGQGDILSGSTGVFVAWARQYWSKDNSKEKKQIEERISSNPTMVGALSASILVRQAAYKAFLLHRRSTVTGNIIDCLGQSMEELFPIYL